MEGMAGHLLLALTTSTSWAKPDSYFPVVAVLNSGEGKPTCSVNLQP